MCVVVCVLQCVLLCSVCCSVCAAVCVAAAPVHCLFSCHLFDHLQFRSADEAHVVAKRLHGLKWPSHNKRALEVEFVSAEEVSAAARHVCELL